MRNWAKKRLRAWLFPELEEVSRFMMRMEEAKTRVMDKTGKTTTFREPVVLVGSLQNCKIQIKPIINQEIVLSSLNLASMLELTNADHALVSYNTFEAIEEKVIKGESHGKL